MENMKSFQYLIYSIRFTVIIKKYRVRLNYFLKAYSMRKLFGKFRILSNSKRINTNYNKK